MVSKSKSDADNSKKTFLSELTLMTRNSLYNLAQKLGIPGRSAMKKAQLVEALEEKKNELKPIIKQIQLTSSTPQKEVKVMPMKMKETSVHKTVKTVNIPSIPEEKRSIPSDQSVSSIPDHPLPKTQPAIESTHVWIGEEGPELPQRYGQTILRALVRDPHWVYVYWEIADSTRESVRQSKGEWIFDVAEAFLRVYNEKQELMQEIPVLLDAMNWYVSLPANHMYEFQLGIKSHDGDFCLLASSNPVSLPPEKPSELEDEEWTVIDEQFSEMLQLSGGLDITSWGGSAEIMPHILRNRLRAPWSIPSHAWPSSHVLAVSSSTVQRRK
ncbi:MAG: DUF4912 domain-containing protein [Candidatus Omnitrophota bacterium]|jgi:hypothetical protein|nr:MAG: DUF4912 domain-containing protein [Candidatus Omnitrophota bacterium]